MIEKLRRQKRLTQQQLADAVGCARTSITQYENGKGHPRFPLARRLAEVLDTTLDELFRDVPDLEEVHNADISPACAVHVES